MLSDDKILIPLQSDAIYPDLQHPGCRLLTMETTGLSPRNSFVMMAALAFMSDDGWHQKILIAENRREEAALLKALRDMVSGSDPLCFFSYYSFFRKFINERWENITGSQTDFFDHTLTIKDLQQQLKPVRRLLPIKDLSRHSIEDFTGFRRKAPKTGRKIAEIYSEFQQKGDEQLLKDLIAHVTEDILAYFSISSLASYCQLTDGQLEPDGQCPFEIRDDQLLVRLTVSQAFPVPAAHTDEYRSLELLDRQVRITLPLYSGKLKYYYPGPASDYYYLPEEDRAIHKSLGQFVDKAHRRKATKKTCYTTKEGLFLQCPPSADLSPLFYQDYHASPAYIICEPEKWQTSPEDLKAYIQAVIVS